MTYSKRLLILLGFALQLSSCDQGVNYITVVNKVVADESKFVFTRIPEFSVINDSLLIWGSDGRFYIANYLSGEVVRQVQFAERLNVRELVKISQANAGDSILQDSVISMANSVQHEWYTFLSLSHCDSNTMFFSFVLNVPVIAGQDGSSTSLSIIQRTMCASYDIKADSFFKISKLDLNWDDSAMDLLHPMFGAHVHNNTFYVAYHKPSEYQGDILAAFDLRSTEHRRRKIEIKHCPYPNPLGVNMSNYFHFQTLGEKCFVDNSTKIFDVVTGTEVLDVSAYVKSCTYINYFTPLDKECTKWMIIYSFIPKLPDTASLDAKLTAIETHRAVIDIKGNTLIADIKVGLARYSRRNDKIVSIEKNGENFDYVVYKI